MAALERNDAVTAELGDMANELDANSVAAVAAFLAERRQFLTAKVQTGEMPTSAQIGSFFTKMVTTCSVSLSLSLSLSRYLARSLSLPLSVCLSLCRSVPLSVSVLSLCLCRIIENYNN